MPLKIKSALGRIGVFLKCHYLAFIFALLVGVMASAALWASVYSAGSAYKGVMFSSSSDDYIYLARIQEILDGHGWAGSPYFYEYKSAKALMLPYGEYFYALPVMIFHVPVAFMLAIGIFLFPAILFFLVYLLIRRLTYDEGSTGNKINAIAGGLFVIMANYLLMSDFMRSYLAGQVDSTYSILWTRTVNPIIGGLLLMSFLLLLWPMVNKKHFYFFIPAGLILGMMTSYFFSWGCALAVAGVLLLVSFLKKEYSAVKSLFLTFAVSMLTSAPFLYNALLRSGEDKGALYTRMGMSFSHAPIVNKIVFTALAVFAIFLIYEFYQNKKAGIKIDNWWWFSFALLLGGALAYNQQIITGRVLSIRHFPQYTTPLAVIAGMSLLYNRIKPKSRSLWLAGISLMIIASIALGASFAVKNYRYSFKDFLDLQKDAAIFSWLNSKAPKDCVVLTVEEIRPREMALLIPAFTHCNVYQYLAWTVTGAPLARAEFNYLAYLRAKSVTDRNIDEYLLAHQEEIQAIYSRSEEEVTGDYIDEMLMNEASRSVAAEYKRFFKLDFMAELKKYRLDYVLVDKKFNEGIVRIIPGLKYIGEINDRYLYEFYARGNDF